MSHRRSKAALMLFAAVMLTFVPPAAHAAEADTAGTAEGWKKVVAYAGCALAVFRSITPADWAAAVVTCSKLYLDEPASPTGGA